MENISNTEIALTGRAIGIETSKVFEGKVKPSGYFWFLGNHSWLVSNNPENKKFRREEKRPAPVDTFLFIDVLNNLELFFEKKDCKEHLTQLITIISESPNKQFDRAFNDYLVKHSKFASKEPVQPAAEALPHSSPHTI